MKSLRLVQPQAQENLQGQTIPSELGLLSSPVNTAVFLVAFAHPQAGSPMWVPGDLPQAQEHILFSQRPEGTAGEKDSPTCSPSLTGLCHGTEPTAGFGGPDPATRSPLEADEPPDPAPWTENGGCI